MQTDAARGPSQGLGLVDGAKTIDRAGNEAIPTHSRCFEAAHS